MAKIKEADDNKVANIEKKANQMKDEVNQGYITIAEEIYNSIFDHLKEVKFSPSQRSTKTRVYSDILHFHYYKNLYDEAEAWAFKTVGYLQPSDPKDLKIKVLSRAAIGTTPCRYPICRHP